MWELFKQDAARWLHPERIGDVSEITFMTALKLSYEHMGLRAMFWARLGGWCFKHRVPLVKGFIIRHMHRRFGLELSIDKPIGGGLYIAHTQGSVLFASKIGRNVTVIHAVTFGMRNSHDFPKIGDNVFVGAGARVLGDITLGDGAKVAANAVVVKDVAPNTTVVGIPAKPLGAKKKSAEKLTPQLAPQAPPLRVPLSQRQPRTNGHSAD